MSGPNFEAIIREEIERAKTQVREQVNEVVQRIYNEAEKLLCQPSLKHSEVTLGVKTGRLRRALKFRLEQGAEGIEIRMWFDEAIAPHAKFVINGTRKIKPHPIFEQALAKVLGDEYVLGGN